MPLDVAALIARNARRWAAMRIDPERLAEFDRVATRLWTPDTKARYVEIQTATGVPAAFIALLHERESSGNWARSLAQGDLLTHRSTNVPAGRIPPPAQPPFTFLAAAVDALVAVDHVNAWHDWSIPGMLTRGELFNGEGYALRGLPSPYVLSGTDQYRSGKFPRDHVFDPDMVDVQLGIAPLFARMLFHDSQLSAEWGTVAPLPAVDHPAVLPPVQVPPADYQTTQWLQTSLNTIGLHEPFRAAMLSALSQVQRSLPLAVDGVYAMATKEAVRGYQRAHGGLLDDGRAGTLTRGEIEKTLAALASDG